MGIGGLIDLDAFVDTRFAQEAYKGAPPKSRSAAAPQFSKDLRESVAPAQAPGADASAKAQATAAAQTTETLATREGKYLTFGVADEQYGIGILDVREIIGMMPIRPVPQMPDFVKGVINLRGKVIPVIDMRMKFGLEPIEYTDRTCIIVAEVSGLAGSTLMGIVVDGVSEVADIKAEEVQGSPRFGAEVNMAYILGLAKRSEGVTILLDIDRVLHADELAQVADFA
jgi:purine-binding chemotaxis protein CheW